MTISNTSFRHVISRLALLLIAPGFIANSADADDVPKTMNGLPLLYQATFESGKTDKWEPTDPTAWKISADGDNHTYELIKKRSQFEPPVRQPYNRSLLKDLNVGSFVLDLKLKSTHKDYPHRDLCLFFGYQDDNHLHYVHFGKRADPHANQIFIVDKAPRKAISITTTKGTNWTDDWHHARIVRDVETGTIAVFFDDMKKPAMTAKDKRLNWGRIGVGSFDDTGMFDEIRLYGEKVDR